MAKEIIYIKYGELYLKGKNKMSFINCLYDSIKRLLSTFRKVTIKKEFDSTTILGFNKTNRAKIMNLLKQVPGIDLIIPAYISNLEFNEISKNINSKLQQYQDAPLTFKVETKRSNKEYSLDSMEISTKLGGTILNEYKTFKVDVHKPHLTINVEIKKGYAIFYFEKIKGRGGFPLGINGRVLILMSGGIDSPVAASLLMKKGFHVDFLTFISPPHTKEGALNKVRKLRKILTIDGKLENSRLYICNFTKMQHEISHISNHSYQITLMRRYFFRIAKSIAQVNNCQAIATGESLGQVASQTIQSMQTIQNSINDFIVLRPLLTYDKIEIINEAKKIGTFDASIIPFADSCSLFVPTNPVTKPTIRQAISLEKELTLMDKLLDFTLKNNVVIEK
ncbi:MAG: tRNA 4-thiouridine(8) synthase ThiI [Mycoplasmataceae bacterium]|jgi:thiamine biosynthesis protein ThiI|nr:tRNA 4-thiouridine(8) synthase ThiI [Mycoplasmataceae bacterium]